MRGYNQSKVNPCVFYKNDSVILTYVDDCIIVPQKQYIITSLIESLKTGPGDYVLIDDGCISNYIGVNIKEIWMGH